MLKNIYLVLGSAFALSCTAAQADSFSPASTTFRFTGPVAIGSLGLTCTLTLDVTTNSSGSDAAVTNASVGGSALCTVLYNFFNLPWDIDVTFPTPPPTGVTATRLNINGMEIDDFSVGRCGPGIALAYWVAGSPPMLRFLVGTNAPLGSLCYLSGDLTQTSPATPLTITN